MATEDTVMGARPRETEPIQRKVFLMSQAEMYMLNPLERTLNTVRLLAAEEGNLLKYFEDMVKSEKKIPLMIATFKDGTAGTYWLRSAYLHTEVMAWIIGWSGKGNGNSVSRTFSARPALCLSPDMPVKIEEFDGRKAYVLGI